MTEIKIGILGCGGRMGITLIQTIWNKDGAVISGGVERADHKFIGLDVGEIAGLGRLDIRVSSEVRPLFLDSDVVLDFSLPEATAAHAMMAAETGTRLVIGTTGTSSKEDEVVARMAEKVAIMRAANMSIGVNLLLEAVQQAAAVLGEDFDIEILEMHHKHKVDAPSGTALALGKAAAEGRGVEHDTVADRGRDGITGERKRGHIGYAVLRGGNVAGDHTVIFATENERIEFGHKATDRAIFARGAVVAAFWVHGRHKGLYGMKDVLGF